MTMSRIISEKIEETVREAAGAEGCLVTEFIGFVRFIDKDGEPCWCTISNKPQNLTMTMGMVSSLQIHVESQLACSILHDHTDEED